jgi:hypothetical protein
MRARRAKMIDGNRQTGRTYRMMQEVVKQAINGKEVYVIAADNQQMKQLEFLYRDLRGPQEGKIVFFSGPGWKTFSQGLPNDAIIFKDHYFMEIEAANTKYLQDQIRKIKDQVAAAVISFDNLIAEIDKVDTRKKKKNTIYYRKET